MNSLDRTIGDSSPIGALLDMIYRKGPEMMRAGGGPLTKDNPPTSRRGLSREAKAAITRKYHQGVKAAEIAADIGCHVYTIHKYIRRIRAKENPT